MISIPRINNDFTTDKRRLFRNVISEYQSNEHEFLFNHARSAILFTLRQIDVKGANVAVMAYNCHTVANAVSCAGGNVIFIDVTKDLHIDTNDLIHKYSSIGFKALIVTHLFGIKNDIKLIKQLLLNVPIIEDCAHAYMSPICGEKGDFTVYSIGQGKFPSVGDGGILKLNNADYLDTITEAYKKIPGYSRIDEYRLYGKLIVRHFLYRPFVYSVITRHLSSVRKTPKVFEHIKIQRISKGISSIYNSILPSLNTLLLRQQARAEEIIQGIRDLQAIPLINPKETNCFMLPLLCENINPIKKYFFSQGIETAIHFGKCIEWDKKYGYKEGDCPNAEYFTKHLLVVPTYR